jgi:hypothetical protein
MKVIVFIFKVQKLESKNLVIEFIAHIVFSCQIQKCMQPPKITHIKVSSLEEHIYDIT